MALGRYVKMNGVTACRALNRSVLHFLHSSSYSHLSAVCNGTNPKHASKERIHIPTVPACSVDRATRHVALVVDTDTSRKRTVKNVVLSVGSSTLRAVCKKLYTIEFTFLSSNDRTSVKSSKHEDARDVKYQRNG